MFWFRITSIGIQRTSYTMSKNNEKIEYNDSRPLDTHVWSNHPDLLEIAKNIWNEIYPTIEYNKGKREKDRFRHLRVLLLDMYLLWIYKQYQYIGYSRNKNNYNKTSRYNDLRLSYAPMIHIINKLIDLNLIDHKMGVNFEHYSKCSRMKPSIKLISSFMKIIDFDHSNVIRIQRELLILKSTKDEDTNIAEYIDYIDDVDTIRMRNNLVEYNKLLKTSDISLSSLQENNINIKTTKQYKKVNYYDKTVRRIFNDGTWELGGRYYGGWWQNINKELRYNITINGRPTIEIDYSAIHIILLYQYKGIDYFYDSDNDPFNIESKFDPYLIGDNTSNISRDFYKTLLLICINAKNILSAERAVRKKVDDGDVILPPHLKTSTGIKSAITAFELKHKPISSFFYKGIGKKLQQDDSELANDVINHFTNMNIPILCIHDSFICDMDYKLQLADKMVEVVNNFTCGLYVTVKLKCNK